MTNKVLLALGFRNGLRDVLLSLGLGIAALSGSQVYVFAAYLADRVGSLGVSPGNMAVIEGLALVGLQLTIAAGVVLDRFGPRFTLACGAVVNVACWVALSFLPDGAAEAWVGLLLLLVLASFAEGFLFLALFKTSVQMHPTGAGVAMGTVSAAMSLALAVCVASAELARCAGPQCWRLYCRVYAVEAAVVCSVGFATLFLFRTENYPWLLQEPQPDKQSDKGLVNAAVNADVETTPLVAGAEVEGPPTLTGPDSKSTLLRSLRLFAHPAFLALFLAYFAAMGSSVTTISSGQRLWTAYIGNATALQPLAPVFPQIAQAFSYANAASNLATGAAAGLLVARLSPRRYYTATLLLMALCHAAISILFLVEARTPALATLLAACLAALGAGFGAFLVLAAIRYTSGAVGVVYSLLCGSFGQTFGFTNFGVFFSWMQVGGSAASVLNPILGGALFGATASYAAFAGLWCGLLLLGGLAMLLVPVTPYRR